MFKGKLQIVSILTALLWVLGVNHCLFESLFSLEQVAEASCTSHSEGDPASHSEGNPCTIKILNAKQQSEIKLAQSVVYKLTTSSFLLSAPDARQIKCVKCYSAEVLPIQQAFLISLSIASNAPPYRSA